MRRDSRFHVESLENRLLLAAQPVISEILASNGANLADKDGEFSDWIEIHNRGDQPAALAGWRLVDNPSDTTPWTFPAVTLNPGERLVVFASDKNILTGPELHTDFKLDAGGEYLALIAPDGTPASEFNPFPTQSQDISWGISPDAPDAYQYFSQPTPGQANQLIASAPVFSIPSTTFNGALTLNLSLPPDAAPGAQIRYTLDRTAPTATSPIYSGPINVNRTMVVRARVFENGVSPGPIVSQSYFAVDSGVQGFNSNLPVVIVDTFGSGMNSSTLTSASAYFIDTAADGRARMLDLPDFAGRGGIRIRGQSSEGFPKDQFAFETWDESNNDRQVSILGMPSESDWILYAPYSEKSLMQNFLAYQWSNRIGQYAVRTRFVEVYLNTDGGAQINTADYHGVYIFMERIDVGQDRVDIAKLTPQDTAEPDITGGYIFKKDKNDGNESGVTTNRGNNFLFADPGENELTAVQKDWLRNHLNEFETALYGSNFKDPATGYARYIDVASFIDHHIMVELAKNIDGFRISTYYTKDRGGKIRMGPVWDYNLSMGNADYYGGQNATGWYSSQLGDGDYPYFRRLFEDPDFQQKYIDRWQELRRDELSTARMMADVNELVSLLSDGNGNYPVGSSPQQPSNNPVVRNFKRWPILGQYVWPNGFVGQGWIDDVNFLKNFMTQRAAWIDSLYVPAPTLSRGTGGGINQPVQVTLSSLPGRAIYYTLDGSDPRLPGGGLSSLAQLYTNPFTITSSARVKARVLHNGAWSGLTQQAIGIDNGLRLTELNYHPDPAPGSEFNEEEFEFLELRNTSNQPINLLGYQFDRGIDHTFGARLTAGPLTLQDFLSSGTGYAGSTLRAGPAAGVASDASGQFLQLLDSSGTASANRVAFNRTSQIAASRFSAELDLRASMTPGSGSVAGAATAQSFDGGGTNYTTRRVGSIPGPEVRTGGPSGSFLRLIHDGVGNNNNRIRFNRTLSGSYNRVTADFDFRASSVDDPADGFSMLLLPTSTYGTSGAGAPTDVAAEEPNLPGVFAIGFDAYPHGTTNEVSLHWNGVQVHSVNIPKATLDLVAGVFYHARVELVHVAGGAQVTVRLVKDAFSANPQTVNLITNHFMAGLNPYDSRVEFAGRSGGANMSVDLDNIDVRYLNAADPSGFSLLLLPTSTFGPTGAGTNLTHFADRPNLAGVFAMDIEFDAATGVQNLVLHYNGSIVHTVPISRSTVDLLSGAFRRLKLDLVRDNAASGVRATVSLLPAGTSGTPTTLASNLLIPGMSIYESRLELAGRASLSPTRIDVDNVSASWLREELPMLAPGQYVVLVKNAAAFAQRYPGVAFDGVYQGSLANNGERLSLLDAAGAAAFDFSWGDSGNWPGRADGRGSSLEVIDPGGNYSLASNWRSSSEYHGTPGAAGVGPLTGVIINEVRSNTDASLLDAIELYNAGPSAIDISGWFLSDSPDNYAKFRIPDDTVLQSGQYIVFDESDFNPTPQTPAPNHFALDGAHGDDVWLVQADADTSALQAFADSVHFGAAFLGETFGRVPNGSPTGLLEPMTAATLGSANSPPRFGPVVISEVMYHPADDNHDLEFIELHNTSSSNVDISRWRLDGAVSYIFPNNTVLLPGQFIAVVRFDPNSPGDSARAAAFRNFYAVPGGGRLAGPYTGLLDNAGDRIRLERPDTPPPTEPTFTPYVQVDQVGYGTTAPWPTSPDGAGDSLTRVTLTAYAGDTANWAARVPTPASLTTSNSPTLTGTTAADLMTLRLDPTGTMVQFFMSNPPTGSPVFARSLASLGQITVAGLDGSDRLVVDYTYGDPIPAAGLVFQGGSGDDIFSVLNQAAASAGPARPLTFDAGGGTNTLFIRGGHFELTADHSGSLTFTADASRIVTQNVLNLASLTLQSSTRLTLKPGGQTHLLTQSLTIDAAATLELSDNTLAVFGGASAPAGLTAINTRVGAARNSPAGRWLGAGITSSRAAANELLGVGAILNSNFGLPLISSLGGYPLTSEWIIVKATPDGDTNLNGQVNADDVMRADRGFLTRMDAEPSNDLAGYAWGDFTYDNRTDISDFFILDRARALRAGSQVLGADAPDILA